MLSVGHGKGDENSHNKISSFKKSFLPEISVASSIFCFILYSQKKETELLLGDFDND